MKRNIKLAKKIKPEMLVKYSQLDEKLTSGFKIGTSAIKKRCEHLLKSMVNKDLKLKQTQDDLNQYKEVVLWYHKDLIEDHQGKEEVFRNVIQMPYSNKTKRLELLQNEIEKVKVIDKTKIKLEETKNISQKLPDEKNWSQMVVSPVMSKDENDTFSPLRLKHSAYPFIERIGNRTKRESRSPTNSNTSLNNSISSCFNSIKDCRINEWHRFEQKPVTNKVCNDCFKKESTGKKPCKQLHLCKKCGIYMHESCRDSNTRKMCIPLSKISLKATGDRTVDLKELCNPHILPMVPSVLLTLMLHIQTFGKDTPDLYRATGRDKDVRELCEKLFDGKPRSLSRFDVQTAGNCLRFILRSLKNPLLSDRTVDQLIVGISNNKSQMENILLDVLKEMSPENLDTFIYLMIHLKIIAESEGCRLNSIGLATMFMPSITSIEMSKNFHGQIIEVIKLILDVEYDFYTQYLNETVFFQHFLKENMMSSSIISRM